VHMHMLEVSHIRLQLNSISTGDFAKETNVIQISDKVHKYD